MHRLAFLLVLLLAAPASAQQGYTIKLDVAQATTAGGGAAGSGSGFATLDPDTNLFSWNFSFSGTTGVESVSHFHVGAPGVPGPIALGLPVGSPKVGSATVSPSQAAEIQAGLWYVNVHTSHSPGGEIRGQVVLTSVPSLSQWGFLTLALLLAVSALWWGRQRTLRA